MGPFRRGVMARIRHQLFIEIDKNTLTVIHQLNTVFIVAHYLYEFNRRRFRIEYAAYTAQLKPSRNFHARIYARQTLAMKLAELSP
jgi:hypothetical protein